MNSPILQLLVLAGIAVFLILRLRSVLGTREGYEKPPVPVQREKAQRRRDFEVIEGGPDEDITDHVPDGSDSAKALMAMKMAEPGFSLTEFLGGSRQAYEMILMAFERGDLAEIEDLLSEDVYASFAEVVEQREREGLTIEATFVGVGDVTVKEATFDREAGVGEITVRFLGELTSVVRDRGGDIIEGDPNSIKRQKDVWTFSRRMGADDPNWTLVATGE
ncbi:Tim44/TimA family putative adaptor protein [Aestuariibius sp. 2305UL40-4]|uniref:Tim44/TimA family putative adaptor protein n=1 Tax=Aestuariibius violaceus TaxID=3234132 RepID=UPI00345E3F90